MSVIQQKISVHVCPACQALTLDVLQDVKWQVGPEYTPADALAQGFKSLALSDTRTLSRTIADWFRSL